MAVKIGINGFGRVGMNVLRAALQFNNIQVMAINHKSRRLPVNENFIPTLAHALKYDTVHGKLNQIIEANKDALLLNGWKIKVFSEAEPAQIPWDDLGVDVVVEATGKFNRPEDAARHLQGGAKRVVLTAPAKGEVLTVVMGVNHHQYDPAAHQVISNASCTTNCLAPVAKVLHENFGIVKGLMTTVHALTNDQQLLDMPHHDLRRGRAGMTSIIPTTTGAAKAVGLVLPELKGKLNGFALRVPTPNVSVVDLVAQLKNKATKDEVNAAFKDAAEGELIGILAYSELPMVSSDYNDDPHSAIVDGPSTMVVAEDMVKVVAWYDNEWAYSLRVLDFILYMAEKGI
ncbi:glyceraldehyde-3-phosphate dehydrogenase [Peptococcaceae bacterium SCADC1_2_3]|nr:glyceraldehyde-3-phosphate dehydrogenase [Peptococcaceae bacterium SCADC1_2_3]HBQ29342.1 type I glyceraldehyde-3-phosphate dehydrogenase [Desulfotomaculum sp.]HCJ79324.1 type I glyceraldehyde-3-phosphate dehydrogenase [Desulfotomaculum sp.]